MNWWGKVVGGTLGFMLGGPLGALLGAAVGHQVDKSVEFTLEPPGSADSQARVVITQGVFFTATFTLLGYLAKSDGHVTRSEIDFAEAVMRHMELGDAQRKTAIRLFRQGKEKAFDLDAVLAQLRQQLIRQRNLSRVFLEIQIQAAYRDGVMHAAEERVLRQISRALGISAAEYRTIEFMVLASSRMSGQEGFQQRPGARSQKHKSQASGSLEDAYRVLGVTMNASTQEIKQAYRRLLAQHHPDKLVAKGLPEEMMKIATEKTRQIKAAYEHIKAARADMK